MKSDENPKKKKYTVITQIDAPEEADTHIQSFIAGFQKAIDIMYPLILEAVKKTNKNVYDQAVSETLKGLQPVLTNRVKESLKDKATEAALGHHKKNQ